MWICLLELDVELLFLFSVYFRVWYPSSSIRRHGGQSFGETAVGEWPQPRRSQCPCWSVLLDLIFFIDKLQKKG